jgi:predicted nucleic acid-binding protein
MKPVLFDSSAILASLDESDRHHAAARAVLARIVRDHLPCFITQYVEAEAHALLLSRLGRGAANDWLQGAAIPVIPATAGEVARAKDLLVQYDDKDWSLCDAISFVVAERRKAITFSFDHHFLQFPRLTVWGIKR